MMGLPVDALPDCTGEMLWRASDLAAQRERLSCARPRCGHIADERQLVLTRQRILRQPPIYCSRPLRS